jgi:hypothetical protein
MNEEGSVRACLEKEFQMRSFLPPAAKWSPFFVLDWRSLSIIEVNAVFVALRVEEYWLGEYMPFRTKIPGPVERI